ncbi:DUF2164 domain-containing protein [Halobacillus karajensis]|uniref:DUF2164 domain-containing protein n=1 Tax=Halobacillus karajensis TaxID=195088 RepID=A0A024P8T2_9BACI|nr:DUF2164 domain-containing protein [Halobacillus karajensis]CDQ21405.1 hypothetical protein BN982_03791 [Halobacillus karajensis]CDQ25340.1 hypothetical protein BN983_03671 [Halobacillus karajensis]CDQ29664.1 hypothetical protein BN981_04085 [Halobacillus karajensis]
MLFNIPKEQRRIMIEEIQQFFLNERDEEISSFAAENVLNFFQSSLAPHFYNNAVNDAIKVLEQQYSSIEEEVRTLERPTIKS